MAGAHDVRADRRVLAAIFVGGFAGAIVRAELTLVLHPRPGSWPWATFAANLAGTLLLGYLAAGRRAGLPVWTYRWPLLGTGFCGALTTFSTLQIELLSMMDRGAIALAVGYGAASIAGGWFAVTAATNLVRRASPTT